MPSRLPLPPARLITGLAMSGAILLITHFLFGAAAAIPVGVATLFLFGTLWYALPSLRGRNAP